jgi:hypothetical protein
MVDQSLGNESGQMTRLHVQICANLAAAIFLYAEAPKPATTGSIASYTATSANVSGAPDAIRIDILRWSTDAERDRLLDAWNLKPTNAGRGGRGGSGRAGRGRSESTANTTAPPTPEAMLATALQGSTTVGYLWSREVAGYAIRYAGRIVDADGSERIVLITNRRLGAVNDLWKPVGADSPPYDFSVIELRVRANGDGEGKTSLNGRVTPDGPQKIVALENYDALPVVFSRVRKQKLE